MACQTPAHPREWSAQIFPWQVSADGRQYTRVDWRLMADRFSLAVCRSTGGWQISLPFDKI
jgi:hypothetical protein